MNGSMNRKSRYRTFRAHSQSPAPNADPKASAIKIGSVNNLQSGRKPYQTIIKAINTSVIRKSTKLVMTDPAGTISRGKYILEIKLAFPTRLLLASLSAVEKNCQGSMAAKTSKG